MTDKPTSLTRHDEIRRIIFENPKEAAKRFIELSDRADAAEARAAAAEKALTHILNAAGGECERATSSIGWCWKYYKPDAEHYADRVCNACIAHAALAEIKR